MKKGFQWPNVVQKRAVISGTVCKKSLKKQHQKHVVFAFGFL